MCAAPTGSSGSYASVGASDRNTFIEYRWQTELSYLPDAITVTPSLSSFVEGERLA